VHDLLALWNVEVQAYADDPAIVIRGLRDDDYSPTVQEVLNVTQSWYEKECLRVNPLKTVITPFTRRRKFEFLKPPSRSGKTIPYAAQVKYLGAILDKTLT